MGLKFRRGTTAEKSGSLAFGEPYVNTTLGTLQIGGTTGDITLSTSGTGSTGNFGAISGSGLDITGNANIGGNLSVGGQLTIGDNTSDTVNVVASLSSSLIPQTDNVFDLGSATKSWRDLYISTGSIKVVSNGTVVSTLSTNADGSQNFPNGLSVTGSLKVSGSVKIGEAGYIKDTLGSIHMYTSGANYNNGGQIQFGGISGSAATGVDNYISFNGAPTTQASNTSVTIWGDNSGGGAALFLNRKSSQGVESWGYSPWTIGVDLGATSTPNGLYIGTGNLFLSRSIEFNYKGLTPNILFSGSGIIPAAANTYDLGTPTKPWREIYVSTGSINFVSNGEVVSTLSVNADGSQNFPNDLLVNGLTVGKGLNSGSTNTAVGVSALGANTTGTTNTAIGHTALQNNTTGVSNTAIGAATLTTISTANANTAVGWGALRYNTTANGNTAVGSGALQYNTTGNGNTAVGNAALQSNVTGVNNTALGTNVLADNVGNNNIGVGTNALRLNTSGSSNIAIGYTALENNGLGQGNIAIGDTAGNLITTGSYNTIIGKYTGEESLSNNIVLADGEGNIKYRWDGTNNNLYGNVNVSGSTYIQKGLVIGGTGSSNPVNYPNALTINGNTAETYGGGIFLSKGNVSQWGIVSDNTDDLIISNNNSFSTRKVKIYDSADKIEFTYSGSEADFGAGFHNIRFDENGIIPAQTNQYDLGSVTNIWKDLYISTGSIKVVSNGEVVSTLSTNADGSQNFPNGLSVTGSLRVSGSLVVSGSTSFNKKVKIGPDIGAGINSSFENALEIGSNPDVGLGGAMFLGNTLGSSTWGMLSNGSNNFAIANQSGFQSRAITLYNTENKIEFLYSGSINANGSGFHNIRFDENGIIPYAANQYDLGSETNYFRDLYVSTGSIKIVANGSVVSSITTNADGSQNFQKGLNVSGSLIVTGSITATGDVVAFSTSDRRHKNNIVLISDALAKVTKLNGVTWEWNEDVDDATKQTPKTGLIAQEVQEVLPEVVKERGDGFLALDYSKTIGLLVESIKELSAKIDRLENK
jgi:hypothetical protein